MCDGSFDAVFLKRSNGMWCDACDGGGGASYSGCENMFQNAFTRVPVTSIDQSAAARMRGSGSGRGAPPWNAATR